MTKENIGKRDEKNCYGAIRGYPGLTHTAKLIVDYIPNSKIYVEPFAGLGRVAKLINTEKMVLNDMSDYAFKFLKSKFKKAFVTQEDFIDCIKRWDSQDTFFFIDPPWRDQMYEFEGGFINRTIPQYYTELLELMPKINGDWFICSDNTEGQTKKALSKSGYENIVLESTKRVITARVKVRMISNKPFQRLHPTLEIFS